MKNIIDSSESKVYEEGDKCPECSIGVLEFKNIDGCRCHINPPCHNCVEMPLVCSECNNIIYDGEA